MDARLLYMFLYACNHCALTIRESVDIYLHSTFKEAIDQDWMIRRDIYRLVYIVLQSRVIKNDRHCTASQHIAWSYEHGIADLRCNTTSLFDRDRRPIG